MKYTRQEIIRFRIINLAFAAISILIVLFVHKEIGFGLLAMSLFFLFRPFHKKELQDDIKIKGEYLSLDEMFEPKNDDDNFTILSKRISSYYMEFKSPKYKNGFKDEFSMFLIIGILDAYNYVFQEKSITVKEIKDIAINASATENPLLEFTVGYGILLCKNETCPNFTPKEIIEAWDIKRESVLQTINEVLNNYPQEESHIEDFVRYVIDKYIMISVDGYVKMNVEMSLKK